MSDGKVQVNPATGKAKVNPATGKAVISSETNSTCCCTHGGNVKFYPLLYCPSGNGSGMCVALTDDDAALLVGKVVLVSVDYGTECMTIGPEPDPPLEEGDCTFPVWSADPPLDDCSTCCNCEGVTQPTAISAAFTLACPAASSIDVTTDMNWDGTSASGCFDYDFSPPTAINCGGDPGAENVVSNLQYNWDPEGLVPATWTCWWTMLVTVTTGSGGSYTSEDVILYKRGGTTALGTYTTITPSSLFNTAVVS